MVAMNSGQQVGSNVVEFKLTYVVEAICPEYAPTNYLHGTYVMFNYLRYIHVWIYIR